MKISARKFIERVTIDTKKSSEARLDVKNALVKIKDPVDIAEESSYAETKAEEVIKVLVWGDKKIKKTEERVIEYTVNKPNIHLIEVSEGIKKQKVTEKILNI